MAEKIISPGVFTNEIDQTFLPSAVADIGAALVGPTLKGPAGIPTVVTSYSDFQAKFGDVFKSGSDSVQFLTSHAAEQYLQNSDTLTVVRILDGTFSEASASVGANLSAGTKSSGSLQFTSSVDANYAAADAFGSNPGDEVQITVNGIETRFIASEADTVPADDASAGIFFFVTGSTRATFIANLVAEIDAAAIGVDANAAWDQVYKANMSKEVGIKEGRPNPLGLPDLVKPEGWKGPSHEGNHGNITDSFQ